MKPTAELSLADVNMKKTDVDNRRGKRVGLHRCPTWLVGTSCILYFIILTFLYIVREVSSIGVYGMF